jgi:hypothetical protein
MTRRITIFVGLLLLWWQPAFAQRSAITASETFYVDPVHGSDANPGTQAQPFLTMQHCGDNATDNLTITGPGAGSVVVTCQSVAAASYSGTLYSTSRSIPGQNGAAAFVFDGNGSSVSVPSGPAPGGVVGAAFNTGNYGAGPQSAECASTPRFSVRRWTMSSPGSGYGLMANGGTINILDGITFGPMPTGVHMLVECGGSVISAMYGSYTITGGAAAHCVSWVFGDCVIQSENVTIAGCAPNSAGCSADGHAVFTSSFLQAQWGGVVFFAFNECGGGANFGCVTGTAEGPRWYVAKEGNIDTETSNPTYVPGSIPGVCIPPAVYAGTPCGQQNGSGSFAGGLTASIGPIYYNAAVITFPQPYSVPPNVSCSTNAVICSIVNPTMSGFSLFAWSYNPDTNPISYTWRAQP